MENEKDSNDEVYFEEIIKKTKTGITFPKNLREDLFDENKDTFFRMIVPNEKDKIILEIKSVSEMNISMTAQLLNYLHVSKVPVGYLINFKNYKVDFKRFVMCPCGIP